jgi:PAS domain-containing protein
VRDPRGDALTEEAFLQATLQHLSEPVLAVDAGGRVRFFNDAFQALRPHILVAPSRTPRAA